MKETWGFLAVCFIIFCISLGFICWLKIVTPLPCIQNIPREMINGSIESISTGFFTSGTAYYLWYKGTKKDSGEVCAKRVRVTAGEYERRIYKRK